MYSPVAGHKLENSQSTVDRQRQFNRVGLAIIGSVFFLFLMVAWNSCSRLAVTDYQGVVLDRWAGYRPSEQGDVAYFKLLIEREDKEKTTVNVDAETYNRIQIGMKVRSIRGKLEVIEPPKKPDH